MTDRIILVCTVLVAGVYLWATAQIPSLDLGDPLGPKAFPRMLGAGLLIAAGMLLLEILKARKAPPAADAPAAEGTHYGVIGGIIGWTALYIFVFERLGFVLSTTVYLLVLTAVFNRGRWLMNGLTSVLFSVGSYAVFTKLLGVNLAPGILPF